MQCKSKTRRDLVPDGAEGGGRGLGGEVGGVDLAWRGKRRGVARGLPHPVTVRRRLLRRRRRRLLHLRPSPAWWTGPGCLPPMASSRRDPAKIIKKKPLLTRSIPFLFLALVSRLFGKLPPRTCTLIEANHVVIR